MTRLLALTALFLLAAACTTPTDTFAPTAEDGVLPASGPAATPPPVPADLQQALVVNVVDGDTIDVMIDGEERRVRYIGIDTPETVDPDEPVGCFGPEASDRNAELVDGQTVGLESDVSETDQFDRLLRYVWLEGHMVNATLVEEGYALVATFPPDVRYAEYFVQLQAQARAAGRGLWSACEGLLPSPVPGVCDYSGTEEPVIKGNISRSSGAKIYHVPGGGGYNATVIDESAGERWFCTEVEALEAGWRRASR